MSQQVKCLVCGAVFDASATICPICGVSAEHFVPYQHPNETSESISHRTKIVIIGAQAAGFHACQAAREANPDAMITLIGEEPYLPYYRPLLTKQDVPDDLTLLKPQPWFEEHHIDIRLNTKVTALYPNTKQIETSQGRVSYDTCVLALGAVPIIPSLINGDADEVVTLRTFDDMRRLSELSEHANRVAVIGGGVLGLEAAWMCRKHQKNVTVVELAERLMPRQLDAEGSKRMQNICREHGITLRLGTRAEAIRVDADRHVSGLILDNGEAIDAEVVILSLGVRPQVELAKQAGLEVNHGIVVNAAMQTSQSDIYAAGDCAEYHGIRYALWEEAVRMGTVAGKQAAGQTSAHYQVSPLPLTFQGMDITLVSAGDLGSNPTFPYRVLDVRDEPHVWERYYFHDNRLCGGILLNAPDAVSRFYEWLNSRPSIETVNRETAKPC